MEVNLVERALKGLFEALVVEGVEQIVERGAVKCLQRVLVVRGDKDGRRHLGGTDGVHHLNAGALGHLHVEKNQVAGRVVESVDGGGSGVGLVQGTDLRTCLQQLHE